MKKLIFLLCVLMSMVACAKVNKIGSVGDYHIYEASTKDAFAPSTTTVLMAKEGDKPEVLNKAAGPSVVGTVAAPVATVTSSVIRARAIEEAARRREADKTVITNHGSKAAAGAVSASEGGNASAEGGNAYSGSSSSSYSDADAYSNSHSNSDSDSEGGEGGNGGAGGDGGNANTGHTIDGNCNRIY